MPHQFSTKQKPATRNCIKPRINQIDPKKRMLSANFDHYRIGWLQKEQFGPRFWFFLTTQVP